MTEDHLNRKLKALTAFRVLFVTVLLGSFFLLDIGYSIFPYPATVRYLIALMYGLTIVYALMLGKVSGIKLAYAQLVIDAAAVVALIFITGGIESWFSFLMLIVVITAGNVLNRRASYIIAVFISILYGLLVDLQFYGLLPIAHNPLLTEKDFLYNIFSHILALYLTAYLIGHLLMRIEKTAVDLDDLSLFNREVIESTPSGLFTTTLNGSVLLFNSAAESITGVKRSEAFGRHVSEVFPFIQEIKTQRRGEEELECDGQRKIIGTSVSEIKDAKGKHIGYIGIFQDLTKLKALAAEIKQKETLATIGELSANIAHEIRNPLASLKGSIELLRQETTSPEQKDRLMSIAISEMDRLNRIIADFLTYSRPSPVEPLNFDLHKVLDRTMDLLENRGAENLLLKKQYSGKRFISADPMKLEQVFLNLGLNALDAMPDGGSLKVDTHSSDSTVEITFTDSGEGIDTEDLDKVFYPFYTSKTEGTGLGLSIAHRIIEKHGGRITVKSAPHEQTEFRVVIPLEYE